MANVPRIAIGRGRRRVWGTALLAASCLGAPLAALAPVRPLGAQQSERDTDQLERPEVAKLTLKGVKKVDENELQQSIATTASHCKNLLSQLFCPFTKSPIFYQHEYFDRAEFARDVLRIRVFYFKRGYRDTQVDTAIARAGPNKVAVTFRITEGPPTTIDTMIVTQTEPVLPQRRARGRLRLREGAPLDLLRLDSTVVRMRQALWDRGYSDAVIDTSVTVDEAANRARVEIRIDPRWKARVGDIKITREGQRHDVSNQTILNSLSFRRGDVYLQSDVLRSQRTLYESNLFSRATIITPPQGDSVKLIDVTVREAPPHDVRTSAGFNTIDFFQVDGRYYDYNFLGNARRLTLAATVGNLLAPQLYKSSLFHDPSKDVGSFGDVNLFLQPTYQASADVTQPWFQSPRNSIGANVFTHRRANPGVVIDRGFGGQLSFTRQLGDQMPASLTYRYELTKVEAGDVYFCINFGVCDQANINALRSRQALSPIALSVASDRANQVFSPSSGSRSRIDLEYASQLTASDYRYYRAFAEHERYFGIGPQRRAGLGKVIAVRARLGWVKPIGSTAQAIGIDGTSTEAEASIIHPRKRFYAGGSQSVRGFGENQLGPRVLTIPPEQLAKLPSCSDLSTPEGLAHCNPNEALPNKNGVLAPVLGDKEFTPRPLGGSTLAEANVEYRFPLLQKYGLGGAVFLDGALLGQGGATVNNLASGTGAITPGFGVRYYSPVGPIRVDVGFNPFLSQDLTVVTEVRDSTGVNRLVNLSQKRTYAPARTEGNALQRALNRITLHFSIGQAF